MLLSQPPPWPKGVPRIWKPLAHVAGPPMSRRQRADALALQHALDVADREHNLQCSALTGTWTETMFAETADHTAHASSAAEGSLLAGTNQQPAIPALFFSPGGNANLGRGRCVGLHAMGLFSTTGTPTLTFQVRASTTAGSSTLSGASLGVSAAITTGSGVTSKQWELVLELTCRVAGQGTNLTTLCGAGWVRSPGGFAAPYDYAIQPTTPDTATWTMATFDASLTYFINLSATWSASSASNTIVCKTLRCYGRN